MSERYTIEKYPHTVWVHRGGNPSLHDEEIPNELNRLAAECETLRELLRESKHSLMRLADCDLRLRIDAALTPSGETP